MTTVIFRTFPEGDVIALFPYEINYPDGCCESYQRIGQHGAADYQHVCRITRPATLEEIAPLAQELERIGYRLKILKRKPRGAK